MIDEASLFSQCVIVRADVRSDVLCCVFALVPVHPQDRLLIAEALIAFAGDARDQTPRERRARELADALLDEAGIPHGALVTQVDEGWLGP